MIKEEIIELAKQAGFLTNEIKSYVISPYTSEDQDLYEEIEAFAKLVAAAEREACAKLCDLAMLDIAQDRANFPGFPPNDVNHIIDEIKEHFGVEE